MIRNFCRETVWCFCNGYSKVGEITVPLGDGQIEPEEEVTEKVDEKPVEKAGTIKLNATSAEWTPPTSPSAPPPNAMNYMPQHQMYVHPNHQPHPQHQVLLNSSQIYIFFVDKN